MANFLIKLAAFLIFATIGVCVFSWAMTLVWAWYIVPAFHVAALNYKTAIGISYLMSMTTYKLPESTMKDIPIWLTPIFSVVTGLVFAAFAGFWLVVLP